jgi:hypothetical protein
LFRQSMAKIEAAAMAECELEALNDYIDEHGSGRDPAEGLAPELTSIITEKCKFPGGNISVTVSILNRKPWKSETRLFRLKVAGRKVHRVKSLVSS